MGHAIEHFTFDVKTSKEEIQLACNERAGREGDGDPNRIRFIDKVFNTREEAESFIKSIDRGWYDNIAVKYKEVAEGVTSKALEKAKSKMTECYHKWYALEYGRHFEGIKSEFIGCKKCGSRIAVKYLNGNYCPVCRADMRPQTAIANLAKSKANYDKALNDVRTIEKELAMKNGKEVWLVKIEYHC